MVDEQTDRHKFFMVDLDHIVQLQINMIETHLLCNLAFISSEFIIESQNQQSSNLPQFPFELPANQGSQSSLDGSK